MSLASIHDSNTLEASLVAERSQRCLKKLGGDNPPVKCYPFLEVDAPSVRRSPKGLIYVMGSEQSIRELESQPLALSALSDEPATTGHCVTGAKPLVVLPPPAPEEAGTEEKEKEAVGETEEEEEECYICLEPYNSENPGISGSCHHRFHLPCLLAWKQRSNVCPVCSAETLHGVGVLEDGARAPHARALDADEAYALRLQRLYLRRMLRGGRPAEGSSPPPGTAGHFRGIRRGGGGHRPSSRAPVQLTLSSGIRGGQNYSAHLPRKSENSCSMM